MMQALVTQVRAFTMVYESLLKKLLKVNINSWTADVREADGVTAAGHECVPEEKAKFVILAVA